MNVGIDIFRAIELNDPINSWKVNTSCCNVGREQTGVLLLHKLVVNGCPLVLLLLAMELIQALAQLERLE